VLDLFMGRMPVQHSGRIEAFSFASVAEAEHPERIPILNKNTFLNGSSTWMRSSTCAFVCYSPRHSTGLSSGKCALTQRSASIDCWTARSADPVVEFNEEIARVLTGHVLFRLVGMPETLSPSLKDWATAVLEGLGRATRRWKNFNARTRRLWK
jgi:hypothetical protein